jgi:hypothetical protein
MNTETERKHNEDKINFLSEIQLWYNGKIDV